MAQGIGGSQFIAPTKVIDLIQLQEGQSIGYLGCGSGGYFSIPMAQRIGQTGKIYAVDILQSALDGTAREARRENITNIEYIRANLEKAGSLPIEARSLDASLLINVLFQNQDKAAIIGEASRLLRKNGKLVIIDWSKDANLNFGPPATMRVDFEKLEPVILGLGYERLWRAKIGDYHESAVYKKIK